MFPHIFLDACGQMDDSQNYHNTSMVIANSTEINLQEYHLMITLKEYYQGIRLLNKPQLLTFPQNNGCNKLCLTFIFQIMRTKK